VAVPKQLDASAKQETSYCIPLTLRDEQIRINTAQVKGRIQPHDKRSDPVAIVGFGPSLKQTWKQIKKFKYVITCSGAHKFLLDKGVVPFAHCEVDPRAHKIELLGDPHPDVIYYPASTCHPKYIQHLKSHNAQIQLWHVFAQDNESEQVLPRGEWAITGGCDIGMRAMTIARFIGFTDLHIFGMDGCFSEDQSHAADHPNRPPGYAETEYEGKKYKTTPALLEAARQVFHELNQMPDVTAKFYGQGLIQEMAKRYERKPSQTNLIAFAKPELISEELRELNAQLHRENAAYGMNGGRHADAVKLLFASLKPENGLPCTILDYGCGKGGLRKALGFPIYEYDPAIPGKDEPPVPADLVTCFDVLEHVEPDKLKFVLDDLKRVTKQVGYFIVHIGAAVKTYADGRNTHLIQQDVNWWNKQLGKHFLVEKIKDLKHEIHCFVRPIPKPASLPITEVRVNGTKAKFYTPNDVTKWRAETLLKKEPITIEWIGGMKPDEVLFDVGANVGGYSVWAGIKGVKVYSFEPEAQNYALLTQNLALNGIQVNAYPLALTDKSHVGSLYLSDPVAGGSCHSFDDAVGFDLKPRTGRTQGCVGMTLDELVESGLPSPDHIKIDVDGFEFKVIKGAEKTLTKGVKSLLVEVNTNLDEHKEMVRFLSELGYGFDKDQVEKSTRKIGPFVGVAEHVFRPVAVVEGLLVSVSARGVYDSTQRELERAIERAELITDPFPHFVMDFPVEVQPAEKYVPIEKVRKLKGYPSRFVGDFARPSWNIKQALLKKFGLTDEGFTDEFLLIKDSPPYSIGPHTDSPARVLSLIAYIGEGQDGTSLYKPKDPKFKCEGGPHHDRKKFKKVKTIPYHKNTALVFLKTDHSFHGVEPIKSDRHVLLYDIRRDG